LYSPDEAGWPGWHVLRLHADEPAQLHLARRARAQRLRHALPVHLAVRRKSDNDVLLYWPIYDFWMQTRRQGRLTQLQVETQQSWFENQPIGKTAHELWNEGYAFDYVSDRQLQMAKARKGHIQMPGGNYEIIVVPECKLMPLTTLKKLLTLAENGATVIFENHLPADVPGWSDLNQQSTKFKNLTYKVSLSVIEPSAYDDKTAMLGSGQILCGNCERLLSFIGTFRESLTENNLSFIRCSFDGGWHYFISNRGATNFDGWVTLGRPAKSVVILDPMTGKSGVAAFRESAASSTEFHLQLVRR
jgi:hypothetical protein